MKLKFNFFQFIPQLHLHPRPIRVNGYLALITKCFNNSLRLKVGILSFLWEIQRQLPFNKELPVFCSALWHKRYKKLSFARLRQSKDAMRSLKRERLHATADKEYKAHKWMRRRRKDMVTVPDWARNHGVYTDESRDVIGYTSIMGTSPTRLEAKNLCADEDQQQFNIKIK
jgi:hypothetical protein